MSSIGIGIYTIGVIALSLFVILLAVTGLTAGLSYVFTGHAVWIVISSFDRWIIGIVIAVFGFMASAAIGEEL